MKKFYDYLEIIQESKDEKSIQNPIEEINAMVKEPADMSSKDVKKIAELLSEIPSLDNPIKEAIAEINKIILRRRHWEGTSFNYFPMPMNDVEKIKKLLQNK